VNGIEAFCRLPYKSLIFCDFFYFFQAFLVKMLKKALCY
jgi:hypothetical protein